MALRDYLRNVDAGSLRQAFRELSIDTMRHTSTYPSSSTDKGNRGDFSFSNTRMAINNGVEWIEFAISDALLAISDLVTSANNLILVTGLNTFQIGQLTNTYVAANAAIARTKLANIATARVIGRGTAGSGADEELALSSNNGVVTTFAANSLKIDTPQDLQTTSTTTQFDKLGVGISPTNTFHITKSEDAVYVAKIRNSHTTGYGLLIEAGADSSDPILNLSTKAGPTTKHTFSADGSYQMYGRLINAVTQISADNDAIDVAGINIIEFTAGGGTVTIGGFANGITGQIVHCVKTNSGHTLILENLESTGTQKLVNATGTDKTISVYGGTSYFYNGSNWYEIQV